MKDKYRFTYAIHTAALTLLLVAFFVPFSAAQKEVEIEIAGPWEYVPDYTTPGNIIVFSPASYHSMIAFDGGDVNDTTNGALHPVIAKPGIHQLTLAFDPKDCANVPPPPAPPLDKLYPVKSDPATIKNVVENNNKGKRFALSLPRPCYYESYLDARAKIDTKAILLGSQEKSYTTWMVFHYTVKDDVTTAHLMLKDDSTPGMSTPWDLTFSKSSYPPTTYAVSIDMYFSGPAMEDYTCDKHSANFFDIALGQTFWNVNNVYRLFPELDHTGKQTNRYNYDPNICQQVKAVSSSHPNEIIASLVGAIRAKLRMLPTPQDPTDQLTALRREVDESFEGTARSAAEQDINEASRTIKNVLDRQKPCASTVADQLLSVTLYIYDNKSPGRADCHSMQLNVADAIK
jgi:hypothetical protein